MELKHSLAALDIIQLSSLSCVLSPGADHLPGVLAEIKTATPHVRITFDPNARPRAANDDAHAAQMRHRINQLVALSDLVKVSDEDLEWLSPGTEPSKTAATWSQQGPSLVVLTRGAEGAKAFINGELVADTTGVTVDVVDTVGAGDTFLAWLIRSIVEDFQNQIPQSPAEILTMLQQAARAAAITCSRKGCVPPLRSEVL
jgi:fructokinase